MAEELHFSRAAERLNMSQPPLSAQIKDLEYELGVQLFKRTKRSVALTKAGHHLKEKAQAILNDINSAISSTQSVNRGEFGELRIGTNYTSLAHPCFTELTRLFHQKYPHVKLVFQQMLFEETVQALTDGTVDISFSWPEKRIKYRNIAFKPVTTSPLRLTVGKGHPLAKKQNIDLADIAKERLLLSPRQMHGRFYRDLEDAALKAGVYLNTYQETVIFSMITHLVSANYGIGFIPEFMAEKSENDLVFLKVKELQNKSYAVKISLAYNTSRMNEMTENFIALVKDSQP